MYQRENEAEYRTNYSIQGTHAIQGHVTSPRCGQKVLIQGVSRARHRVDSVRESGWQVPNAQPRALRDLQALIAVARGDDRAACRHGLQDFEAAVPPPPRTE